MRTVLAVLLCLVLVEGPVVAQDYSLGGGRYKKCLDKVATDPQGAHQQYRYWREVDEWQGGPALHCEALILTALRQYSDAAQRLEQIVSENLIADVTLQATILGQAGNAWILAKKGDLALAALDRAIAMNDQDYELVVDRARAHALLKDWPAALKDLDTVIEVAKPSADHRVLRAVANRHLGRYDAARADVDAALVISTNHGGALLERGILKQLQGDVGGARKDYVLVVTNNPNTDEAADAQSRLQKLDLKLESEAPAAPPATP